MYVSLAVPLGLISLPEIRSPGVVKGIFVTSMSRALLVLAALSGAASAVLD